MSRSKDTWLGEWSPAWVESHRLHREQRADEDGREPVVAASGKTIDELINDMYAGIRRLHEQAVDRENERLAREMEDELRHPDAPHPDAILRARSRKLWYRMRRELRLEHAPWHHHEIYIWAASTARGLDWLEAEIAFWENRVVAAEDRRARWAKSRKRAAITGEPADLDEIYWGDA